MDLIPLTYKEEGQNIYVNKKKLTFNQLMTIVDNIEGFKNKTLTKCLELYESSEKEIIKITEKYKKFLLGLKNYERYLKEKV